MNPSSVSLRSSQSKAAVPSSPKLRLQQREQINPTAHGEPTADPLKPLLQSYRRRVRLWRVQRNWLPSDWFEEIEATQAIAAWQAGRAYDPSSGLQYEVFVYQEVMARALARYQPRMDVCFTRHFDGRMHQLLAFVNGANDDVIRRKRYGEF
jgi:hypothetical protein